MRQYIISFLALILARLRISYGKNSFDLDMAMGTMLKFL